MFLYEVLLEEWSWFKISYGKESLRNLDSSWSVIKEINLEYSLEGLIIKLKLKLQYFDYLMRRMTHWKRPCCWERLRAGEGDDRGWDGWMASPTQWTWVWVNSGVGDGQGGLACCSPWGRKELTMTERLNWTESAVWLYIFAYLGVINGIKRYVTFPVWLLQCSVLFSRFRHAAACVTISFIVMADSPPTVWVFPFLSIYCPMPRWC